MIKKHPILKDMNNIKKIIESIISTSKFNQNIPMSDIIDSNDISHFAFEIVNEYILYNNITKKHIISALFKNHLPKILLER